MLFYGNKGRQCLDLSGNLIISANKNLVMTPLKRYAPKKTHDATRIMLQTLSFWGRIKACWIVIRFIMKYKKPKPDVKPVQVKKADVIPINAKSKKK